MDKVVRIENRIVSIGKSDGSLEEFDIAYFNFDPRVGDTVRIYRSDDNIVIAKEGFTNEAERMFTVQSGHRVVNKILYALLAFIFGWIGAQEFYAGNSKGGILSVIFFWTGIPYFYGIYKGIVALTKSSDEFGNITM